MIISSNLTDKRYKNDFLISPLDYDSHFNHNTKDIVIYLPQVLQHSLDCNVEQAFTQHVTHELIHKLIDIHINESTSRDFDNLGSRRVYKIEDKFSLRNWFGGMLDKEV